MSLEKVRPACVVDFVPPVDSLLLMHTSMSSFCDLYRDLVLPAWSSPFSSDMCSDKSPSSEIEAAPRISNVYSARTSYYTTASANSNRVTSYNDRPSTRTSVSARAGSFDGLLEPDPERDLLLRFRALPMELTLKIVDDVVRVAVDSLYTGCRACRWQEWSRCICRHWQKTFCTLASLDNTVGEHTRRFGKELARNWGYSSVDAFGPYAAGFRFTGPVIGGLRMADFIFVDEKLTALPEPEYEDIFALTKELNLGPVGVERKPKLKSKPKPEPESYVEPEPTSFYWLSNKSKKIGGLTFDIGHAVTFGSRLDCANLPQAPEKALPAIKFTAGNTLQQPKKANGSTLSHFRPSANSVFQMISATASKLRGHGPPSSNGGFSFIHAHGCGKGERSPLPGSYRPKKRQKRDVTEIWDTPMNLDQ